MEITEVAPSTFLINPALDSEFSLGEIIYVLVDTPPVLIEPGSTTTASRLLGRSAALGLNLDGPVYIIPTHIILEVAIAAEDAKQRVVDRLLEALEQLALSRAVAVGGALREREVLPTGN